ncbi:hypothetical protein MC7420_3360 [Coleofasciculus chthonoplastes PCC 7420]|uniref:Uncharacterized protein n=1 Tax=Coleofasciculus chthonoplastes PCC 7420 TaxID=118168 RepID=B4VYU9_9CYAN|nr:hypothetical protein MC7420_3360 [Coleofasciculus chthonoplastes PCC 7420]
MAWQILGDSGKSGNDMICYCDLLKLHLFKVTMILVIATNNYMTHNLGRVL